MAKEIAELFSLSVFYPRYFTTTHNKSVGKVVWFHSFVHVPSVPFKCCDLNFVMH